MRAHSRGSDGVKLARTWCVDNLPSVRCLMIGPRWRRHFGVERRPLCEVRPPWHALVRHGRRWVLCFTLEDDVRERVLDGIRPGVYAEW